MTHADPTPRSPADVLRDNAYKLIESEELPGQTIVRITVLHRGSEQLYQTEYPLFAAQFPCRWYPVVARQRMITEYVRAP